MDQNKLMAPAGGNMQRMAVVDLVVPRQDLGVGVLKYEFALRWHPHCPRCPP